jgi:hypothetical protein
VRRNKVKPATIGGKADIRRTRAGRINHAPTTEMLSSMTSLRLGLLASLVLPLGLATASFAQPAPTPPPPAADAPHHHHDPAQMRAHMAERLRAVLQLTPAQDPALNTFLDSMQPPPGADMERHHDHDQQGVHLTTPARLDKMLAHLDSQRTHLAAHAAAVKTFYAQLTPSQQTAFDDLAPMMMHHGDGDHHDMAGADGMHHHHDGDHPMGPGGPPQG